MCASSSKCDARPFWAERHVEAVYYGALIGVEVRVETA